MIKNFLLTLSFALLLAACAGTPPPVPEGKSGTPSDIPKQVKVGKPYRVFGKEYNPHHNPVYDEIGIASWYGPGFHGKPTATGETFNQYALTAAHTTLPMPCMVRVTNLENGKSAIVRVNDRGPFKDDRIIDLSRGSAEALGVTGLARVRVQYLEKETKQCWADMGSPPPAEALLKLAQETSDASESEGIPAPVLSVASTDLPSESSKPSPEEIQQKLSAFKVRPIAPKFEVISEANAQSDQLLTEPQSLLSPPEMIMEPAPQPAPMAAIPEPALPKSANTASHSAPGWYVQVGVFGSEENASKLSNRLREDGGFPVATTTLARDGMPLYRVRVGPFGAQGEASHAASRMSEFGISDARVIEP